ncbi:MAG: phytoene desaturase [Saprospiraceae bacterium]|nr:phytoene desaturase [Saprospiraceae bacterium]
MKNIGVIGSGFAGLAAACCLAKAGYRVTVFEKNESLGGRARVFKEQGFTFDMGPSWYWMPEVFENFYQKFGKTTSDFYNLVRLDPSYKVIFGKDDEIELPSDYNDLRNLFESLEDGAGNKLDLFLKEAEYKYKVGMNEFVWKPGISVLEFADLRVVKSLFKLQMLSSLSSQVEKLFKSKKIREILKFPVLFLGATPENTPALYSLMNYADLKLGTWYPMDGMHKIIEAFLNIASELGVEFKVHEPVKEITVSNNLAKGLTTSKSSYEFDFIISGADYHHTEQELLPSAYRSYSTEYWESRTMAPSSLLFYLGINKKIHGLLHHNLYFDKDFNQHAHQIYTEPSWPSDPLFYICCPSVTDSSVAPPDCENLFILMPLAPGIEDNEDLREKYFGIILDRLFSVSGIEIKDNIIFKRSYCVNDFIADYNAFKGNAYGLANVLSQTAFLKPKLNHKKLKNLYYAGQLTTPGPGMPPSVISGQVVADLIINKPKI